MSTQTRAQSFEMLGVGVQPGPPLTMLRANSSLYEKTQNASNLDSTSIQHQSLSGSTPFQDENQGLWTFGVSDSRFEIGSSSQLKKGAPIPSLFQSPQFSVGWNKKSSGGQDEFWGANLGFGSPSDQPFADEKQISLHGILTRGLVKEENHQWILVLFYSNNLTYLRGIPLPGAAYVYTPSKSFRGIFGVPFAFIKWDWDEKWSSTFLAFAFQKIKLEITYKIAGPVQAAIGLESDQQVFMRRDRPTDSLRFSYADKKIFASLKTPLHPQLFAELTLGESFDRMLFETEKYADRNDNNLLLGNAAFVFLQLSSRF